MMVPSTCCASRDPQRQGRRPRRPDAADLARVVIVHDIKGENWALTSGWRARFGRVLLFDPTNPESAAYDPLLEVRRGEWEVRDVQNIADVLVDPEGALERRNHWEKTSHSLLVGAILHVLYAEPDKTLAGVANFLSDPRRPIDTTLEGMMKTPHLGERGVHPVVASAARELLNKSANERSGVLSTGCRFSASTVILWWLA
jgi:type IV secretion system protein VirD4